MSAKRVNSASRASRARRSAARSPIATRSTNANAATPTIARPAVASSVRIIALVVMPNRPADRRLVNGGPGCLDHRGPLFDVLLQEGIELVRRHLHRDRALLEPVG